MPATTNKTINKVPNINMTTVIDKYDTIKKWVFYNFSLIPIPLLQKVYKNNRESLFTPHSDYIYRYYRSDEQELRVVKMKQWPQQMSLCLNPEVSGIILNCDFHVLNDMGIGIYDAFSHDPSESDYYRYIGFLYPTYDYLSAYWEPLHDYYMQTKERMVKRK